MRGFQRHEVAGFLTRVTARSAICWATALLSGRIHHVVNLFDIDQPFRRQTQVGLGHKNPHHAFIERFGA